jgi:hypothetical protein
MHLSTSRAGSMVEKWGSTDNGTSEELSFQADVADGEGANGRTDLILKLNAGSGGDGRER